MMLISFGLTALTYLSEQIERAYRTRYGLWYGSSSPSAALLFLSRDGGHKTPLKGLCHTHMHTLAHMSLSIFYILYINVSLLVCVTRFFFKFTANAWGVPKQAGESTSPSKHARNSCCCCLPLLLLLPLPQRMCNDTNIAKSKTSKHHRHRFWHDLSNGTIVRTKHRLSLWFTFLESEYFFFVVFDNREKKSCQNAPYFYFCLECVYFNVFF